MVDRWEQVADFWNGKTWTLTTIDPSGPTDLLAVSCVTSEQCLTVGSGFNSKPSPAEYLDQTWSTESLPGPDQSANLAGVSCETTTPVICMAVGSTPDRQLVADVLDASTH